MPTGIRSVSASERGVAALPVDLAEGLELLLPRHRREVGRDGRLGERARAQDLRLGRDDELLADRVRREDPADPQAGRERLGERADVDDAVAGAGPERRNRLAVEAEQTVRVVFEDQQVGRLADGEDLVAPGVGDA